MHRSSLAPAATALLLAAATLALPAQAQAQPREPVPSAPSRACYAAMWKNPAIAPVIARLAGNSPEATQALRASTDKASDAEKPAITAWQAETKKCQQLPMF